jgi:hypothetical protein
MSAISEMRQSAQAMENAAVQFERQADLARKQSEVLTNSANELEQLESDSNAASNGSPKEAKRGPGRPKGSTAVKRGPGRPKGSTSISIPTSTSANRGPGRPKGSTSKRAKNKMSLRVLVLEILKTNRHGLELKEVVSACRIAGYKSNTTGDFSQIVYQTLYKLKNDIDKVEKRQLVVKDAASKKYKLSPKPKAA